LRGQWDRPGSIIAVCDGVSGMDYSLRGERIDELSEQIPKFHGADYRHDNSG
jgi:hypothetical protein